MKYSIPMYEIINRKKCLTVEEGFKGTTNGWVTISDLSKEGI